MDRLAQLTPQLAAWSRSVYGSGADVAGVRSLGGHSAITVGFDVMQGPRVAERLVLKIPPPGVNRQNNFDVLRQVPLLQALERHRIPAPKAVHWSDDERHFGAPFLMMSRLAGAPLPDLFGPDAGKGVTGADRLFEQPIRALVALHGIDARAELAGWNVVRLVDAEIEHWVQVFRKSSIPEWIELAERVRDLLHRHTPADPQIGLVHGDFYSNNWVFDGPLLSGVVDWEGSSIGPSLL
ncbi:phosphotransferase family protein, partial [Bosea sp. (in: a-proteobacteria)]|uniref:phosphotransferase family protein n=1 Tax=Bosea sp. (in: a-proteobacteria) TaxID=1871050 RepID=UPI0025BB1AFA